MMKKLFTLFLLSSTTFFGQINTVGDMAFTAFNADGNDDLAMVTFKNIPIGTILFFTDSEWNGSSFGVDEGDFQWNSGLTEIPAGTRITFNNLLDTPSVSHGSIIGSPGDISGTSDAIFAYIGSSTRVPTTFIAAIANHSSAYGSLENTDLEEGTTALTLTNGADIAQYNGSITGMTVAEYKEALFNINNYDIQNDTGDQSNDLILPDTPFNHNSFSILPEIMFSEISYGEKENTGTITIQIELSEIHSSDTSVEITLNDNRTALKDVDFLFTDQTATIDAGTTSKEISITINDNNLVSNDKFFALELENPTNAKLNDNQITTIHILDDDRTLEYPNSPEITITHETSFLVDDTGTAEIVTYNPTDKLLYVLNSEKSAVEIFDFSDLTNITKVKTVDLSSYGTSGATSVAYFNEIVVASVSNGPTANGVLVFMDKDGNNASSVIVGNLPDHVSFTPDGTKVLSANEGQPNDDYSIDPEGSIAIIDVTLGLGNISQGDVTTINFNTFDSEKTQLITNGIRITGPNGTSVSQDLEPEYITYSNDSKTAWVSLQENNALAKVDIATNTITEIIPLGIKEHSLDGNSIDTSDKNDFIFMATWPIKGMYMPDAIAQYEILGVPYIITANEGDSREYDTYLDEADLSDVSLDPTVFPDADILQLSSNLGRLVISTQNGDTDNDGDLDAIYSFGSRSFSIYNGNTGEQVYDSGDDFERYTAEDPTYGDLFNASNSNNKFKNRSDNKGPEPEGVTTAIINGKTYAFITLERVGGFMTYDVTDPANPEFIAYKNNRSLGNDEGGDLGPEGIIYIAASESPNDNGLIVMANEKSSTVSVYSINNENSSNLSTDTIDEQERTLKTFPNPVNSSKEIYFNKEVTGILYDLSGRKIIDFERSTRLNVTGIQTGTYIIKTTDNETSMILIK